MTARERNEETPGPGAGTFHDHYSERARQYATFRPSYPAGLFTLLADLAPGRSLCWDCCTGNGQAAVAWADHFERVVATDASAEQLAHAAPHPRIDYRCEFAESSSLSDRSVPLISVASALHWLDREQFYAEVRRVAAPGAILAAFTYGRHIEVDDAVDRLIRAFANEILADYWPPGARLVYHHYRDLPFPFTEVHVPKFAIEVDWTLHELIGLLDTWSPSNAYRRRWGVSAVESIRPALDEAWGPADRRPVRLPIGIRAGVVEA